MSGPCWHCPSAWWVSAIGVVIAAGLLALALILYRRSQFWTRGAGAVLLVLTAFWHFGVVASTLSYGVSFSGGWNERASQTLTVAVLVAWVVSSAAVIVWDLHLKRVQRRR